jgi:hypothetical protein
MATSIDTPDGPLSYPPQQEILAMEIEQRLAGLSPADRSVVDDAMEGMSLQGKYELIESFFVED